MISIKKYLGVAAVLLLTATPFVMWVVMKPLGVRLTDGTTILTSLGQIAGLTGMTLFAINLILSARLKWLEDYFNGLNVIYLRHHLIGAWAFILLLIHPTILAIKYWVTISAKYAASFLLPHLDRLDIAWGIFALLLMIVLLVLTFFWRPAYETWKFTHKFLGLSFFLASLHVLLIPSDVSINPVLKWYLLTLAGLGLLATLYRSWLNRWLVKRLPYIVTSVQLMGESVEIQLNPQGRTLKFLPGQFVFVSFIDPNIPAESHPFSIASNPQRSSIKLVAKLLGDFTKRLPQLAKGATAQIEGPFGRFSYRTGGKDQLWIAGGIGITPFLGMARDLAARGDERQVHLYYSISRPDEALFADELADIAGRLPSFNFSLINTKLAGRLTAAKIIEQNPKALSSDIFICGPSPMMKSLRQQFVDRGVNNTKLHSEEFEL